MADATAWTTGFSPFPEATGTPPPGWVEENGRFIPFWYSRTGVIVKWSLFLGLSALLGLYLFIGYMHAKRRLKKGLVPLAYHRWLVSKAELSRVDPRYGYPQAAGFTNHRPDYYGMQPMNTVNTMPPPIYDPNAARPPMYDGPVGSSKVDAAQMRPDPVYAPPPGPPPPPAAVTATHTGSSNNPYRT